MCHRILRLSLFVTAPAPPPFYTLSLHDALPISPGVPSFDRRGTQRAPCDTEHRNPPRRTQDRKSTRLNSSHVSISYAVFCLKKKNKHLYHIRKHNGEVGNALHGSQTTIVLISDR